MNSKYDLIIVGGGLYCCVSIKAFLNLFPNGKVLIIERGPTVSKAWETTYKSWKLTFVHASKDILPKMCGFGGMS